MSIDQHTLVAAAETARRNAHAPYSRFKVGAAVLDEHGTVHSGCNVENASYPEGICAETNAIGTMVAAGGRSIVAIAIVGGAAGQSVTSACTPCGGCRQRILEFSDHGTAVFLSDGKSVTTYLAAELLPFAFDLA